MLEAHINWWRGYSDEDMGGVKERLSDSEAEGIYVTGPERLAPLDLHVLLKAKNGKVAENLPQTET